MLINPDYETARDALLAEASAVDTERVPLDESAGRVLAEDLVAREPVPAFDRSAYDGYAFRAEDVGCATQDAPVTLTVVCDIPAGSVPSCRIEPGTAAKILTGAPIPEGADTVVAYERTQCTDRSVALFAPVESGANIVRTGEDVQAGTRLALAGTVIDAGLAGSLAAQGNACPSVYRKPVVGIISTGNEVVETGEDVPEGKIRNTNRHVFAAALKQTGCEPLYLGCAGDSEQEISALIERGIESCDAVLLTGGVSAGDLDRTPHAMVMAGAALLVRGVSMKPGMACAYSLLDGKLLFGLSGNPASALTSFYAVVQPALKKMCGRREPLPRSLTVELASDFPKKTKATRLLRGTLDLASGSVLLRLPESQGNAVISSAIGCDAIAVVPAGSGALKKGTVLKGFIL
ncbi:MAG: gephyrin-like molybdotransferase Glp [Anaerovoracaceae bacterium]